MLQLLAMLREDATRIRKAINRGRWVMIPIDFLTPDELVKATEILKRFYKVESGSWYIAISAA